METYEDRFPKWFDALKTAKEHLDAFSGGADGDRVSVVRILMDITIAYAWLFIVRK